jgi:hypothetical protein
MLAFLFQGAKELNILSVIGLFPVRIAFTIHWVRICRLRVALYVERGA